MAKSPRLGGVKRRLSQEIGGTEAIRFYRACLTHTLMRLGADSRWQTLLAVTPDAEVTAPVWPGCHSSRIGILPQGRGDLGHRMQALFERLPPGPVVIVGSDIPDLTRADIAAAFAALNRADAVLGPARDGGYWLIGLKQPKHAARLRMPIRWSSAYVLADTRQALGADVKTALLRVLSDIDTAEDYRTWLKGCSGKVGTVTARFQ